MEEGEAKPCMLLARSNYVQRECYTFMYFFRCHFLPFQVSGTLQPRWGHSITAFSLVDGVTDVSMFGGSKDPYVGSVEKQSKLADTTSLQFCKYMNVFMHDGERMQTFQPETDSHRVIVLRCCITS